MRIRTDILRGTGCTITHARTHSLTVGNSISGPCSFFSSPLVRPGFFFLLNSLILFLLDIIWAQILFSSSSPSSYFSRRRVSRVRVWKGQRKLIGPCHCEHSSQSTIRRRLLCVLREKPRRRRRRRRRRHMRLAGFIIRISGWHRQKQALK